MTTRVLKDPTGDTDWMTHAKCAPIDGDLFFPEGTRVDAVDQRERAQAICAECPVREACLEYALANRIDHGVWGGESEAGRRRILRQRKAPG